MTVETTVTADCPFCGGTFNDMVDPATNEPTGLMHSLPMCLQFRALEPAEFLKAVNDFNASAAFDPLMKKERGQA